MTLPKEIAIRVDGTLVHGLYAGGNCIDVTSIKEDDLITGDSIAFIEYYPHTNKLGIRLKQSVEGISFLIVDMTNAKPRSLEGKTK